MQMVKTNYNYMDLYTQTKRLITNKQANSQKCRDTSPKVTETEFKTEGFRHRYKTMVWSYCHI